MIYRKAICETCGIDRRFRANLQQGYEKKLYKQMYDQQNRQDRLMLKAADSAATNKALYKSIEALREKISHLEETVQALFEE